MDEQKKNGIKGLKDRISGTFKMSENESRYFEGETDDVPPIDIPDEERYRMDYGTSTQRDDDEDQRPRKKRRRKHYILRIAIVILVIVLAVVFMKSDYFKVKKIAVKGNQKYSRAYILKKADINKKQNIFFDLDASDGEDVLLSNPYFAESSIERDLPGRVIVTVKERSNAARIIKGSRNYIIDKDGILLRKTKRDLEVTLISGVKVNDTQRGETVTAKNQKLLDRSLEMLKIIREGDLFFKNIDLSKHEVKLYLKDKLYCRGESDNIKHVIKNGNLRKVIYDLKKDDVDKGTITILKDDYISFSKKLL